MPDLLACFIQRQEITFLPNPGFQFAPNLYMVGPSRYPSKMSATVYDILIIHVTAQNNYSAIPARFCRTNYGPTPHRSPPLTPLPHLPTTSSSQPTSPQSSPRRIRATAQPDSERYVYTVDPRQTCLFEGVSPSIHQSRYRTSLRMKITVGRSLPLWVAVVLCCTAVRPVGSCPYLQRKLSEKQQQQQTSNKGATTAAAAVTAEEEVSKAVSGNTHQVGFIIFTRNETGHAISPSQNIKLRGGVATPDFQVDRRVPDTV